MRQALHIFKKDIRYLRNEIVFVLVVTALALWLVLRGAPNSVDAPTWLMLLLMVAAHYMMVRAIHAEPIPGDNQFWLTRPYRWKSLLGAKLLFAVVFVSLPVFVIHSVGLIAGRFPLGSSLPGLVWSQVIMILCVSLPVATLAALTSGIVPFLLLGFVLTLPVALTPMLTAILHVRFGPVDWILTSLVVLVLAGTAAAILYAQYRRRGTWPGRILGPAGIALCVAIYVVTPRTLLFSAQSWLTNRPADSRLQFSLAQAPATHSAMYGCQPLVQVILPVTVGGFTPDVEPMADAFSVTLLASDGAASSPGWLDLGTLSGNSPRPGVTIFSQTVQVDRSFFDAHRGQPLILRGSIYLTLLGNTRAKTIPAESTPVNVMDGIQCATGLAEWDIHCRAPFRWPARMIYAQSGVAGAQNALSHFISYSPFPADLGYGLTAARSTTAGSDVLHPQHAELTISVKEPVSHVHRTFEIPDVHLIDYAIPCRDGKYQKQSSY